MVELTDQELLRYHRQISLRGFDFEAQEALKASRVLVIGLGGLGCAATPYLVSAGVGKLTLVDDDDVELHNLQRQILHNDQRIGMNKAQSALQALRQLNPATDFDLKTHRLDDVELESMLSHHDVVVDCCDNLATRNQLNRLCFATKTPLVSGAAIRMEGQISVFLYQHDAPCYQCFSQFFGQFDKSCANNGVLAPVVGVIGAMQAVETIKVLTQFGESAQGQVLMYDAFHASWNRVKLKKNANCSICGHSTLAQ